MKMNNRWMVKPLIWIEGLIGSGKTTLLNHLQKELNLRAFYEPHNDNPYLKNFYNDPKKYAILNQMWFALKRIEIHNLASTECMYGDKYSGCIIDRGLPGDKVFENINYLNGNISKTEHELYELMYKNLINTIPPCSLIIYLDVDVKVAKERIKKRNREYEKNISYDYLLQIKEEHEYMLKDLQDGKHEWSGKTELLIVDWNKINDNPKIIINEIINIFPKTQKA